MHTLVTTTMAIIVKNGVNEFSRITRTDFSFWKQHSMLMLISVKPGFIFMIC